MAAKIQYLFGITKENGEEDSKKEQEELLYLPLRQKIFFLKGNYI